MIYLNTLVSIMESSIKKYGKAYIELNFQFMTNFNCGEINFI